MSISPVTDPDLDARLRALTAKVFVNLRMTGYGRTDIRMEAATGKLMFLEMNPNCSIFYPPGLNGSADEVTQVLWNIAFS